MVDETRKRVRFISTGIHQPKSNEAIRPSLVEGTALSVLRPFSPWSGNLVNM